jgi:hypothetical protein
METAPHFFWKKYRNRVGIFYFVIGVISGIFLSTIVFYTMYIPLQSPNNKNALVRGPTSDSDGWSLVHVFYGDSKHIVDNSAIPRDYFQHVRWFSQARQDEFVAKLLRYKRNGYFIDLAANDPVKISNTYALETHFGWTGLCLEPNPVYWAGLSYRTCHTVGAVVGSNTMQEISFKFPNRAGPKGGIVGKQFDNKQPSKFNEDHLRFTVTLRDIFRRFGTPRVIDYLSLDVEGAEYFVMDSFPFHDFQFNVLTVERPSDVLSMLLSSNGYVLLKYLKRNSGETIWIHKSIQDNVDMSALELNTDGYVYRDTRLDDYEKRDDPGFHASKVKEKERRSDQ